MGYCTSCWPEKNILGPRKTGTISSEQTKLISSSFRKTLAEIDKVMNSNKAVDPTSKEDIGSVMVFDEFCWCPC